jgi:transposase-like protein
MVLSTKNITKGECLMSNNLPLLCPKSNNSHHFYRYGKDKFGNQKYQCRQCKHQFAPSHLPLKRKRKYPPCPKCGKCSFLHHDYQNYSNFRCSDKQCNHSFFSAKADCSLPASVENLFGKSDLRRMRFPVQVIVSVLTLYFMSKNSCRCISLLLSRLFNICLSHVTVAAWCSKFAPIFRNLTLSFLPLMNFNSDEWHADETVVKIKGQKYYIWLIVDSETRFCLGFHLTKSREESSAMSLFKSVNGLGSANALVSDRLPSYNVPVKICFPNSLHIKVKDFKDDISNNLIESFNKTFKSWYNTKQGFNSFESANNLICVFIFFYNFLRPHSSLNNLTPAQVAGLNYNPKPHNIFSHKAYMVRGI